jgi:hypothetical protein
VARPLGIRRWIAEQKGEQPVFRCALEPADCVATLEVPQWMFDPAVCYRIAMASNPNVSVETLRELARLFAAIMRAEPSTVVEAEHLPMPDPGGAYAIWAATGFVDTLFGAMMLNEVTYGTAIVHSGV